MFFLVLLLLFFLSSLEIYLLLVLFFCCSQTTGLTKQICTEIFLLLVMCRRIFQPAITFSFTLQWRAKIFFNFKAIRLVLLLSSKLKKRQVFVKKIKKEQKQNSFVCWSCYYLIFVYYKKPCERLNVFLFDFHTSIKSIVNRLCCKSLLTMFTNNIFEKNHSLLPE